MAIDGKTHVGISRWQVLVGAAALAVAAAAEGQNLVVNGGFDTDLGGWTEGAGNTAISWSPIDGGGDPASGSVRLVNPAVGANPRNFSQCIELTPGETVRLSARYFLEGAGSGAALLFALQFPTPGCSGGGTVLPGANQPGFVVGQWSPLAATVTLGEGFRAIDLRLAVIGNGRAAQFDDVEVEVAAGDPPGVCQPDATTLCLVGDRYEVRASWRTATASGLGQAIEINDGGASGTGYFWFFEPANVEVVVKVLDACGPPFDHVWVFAGGLTNQEVELRVTDTLTGERWTHLNPLGRVWSTVTDTRALDVCD
jgi:hypothetical protein